MSILVCMYSMSECVCIRKCISASMSECISVHVVCTCE